MRNSYTYTKETDVEGVWTPSGERNDLIETNERKRKIHKLQNEMVLRNIP